MVAQKGDLKWKEGETSSRMCYHVLGKKHIGFDNSWQSLEVFSLFVVYTGLTFQTEKCSTYC